MRAVGVLPVRLCSVMSLHSAVTEEPPRSICLQWNSVAWISILLDHYLEHDA
jgi:hypothetical protein